MGCGGQGHDSLVIIGHTAKETPVTRLNHLDPVIHKAHEATSHTIDALYVIVHLYNDFSFIKEVSNKVPLLSQPGDSNDDMAVEVLGDILFIPYSLLLTGDKEIDERCWVGMLI